MSSTSSSPTDRATDPRHQPRLLRWPVPLYIFGTFYATMAVAGYVIEVVFGVLGIIPADRLVKVISHGPTWNYTTVVIAVFLILAARLVSRFLRTGGPMMVRMMGMPADVMEYRYRAERGEQPRR